MQSDLPPPPPPPPPPPSYTEATRRLSSTYLAGRSAPPSTVTEPAPDLLAYAVAPPQGIAPPVFPIEEPAWTARDITSVDWATLLAELAGASDDVPQEARATAWMRVLNEWNASFFAPRGCRIDMVDKKVQGNAAEAANTDTTGPTSSSGGGGSSGQGFGFRVGGSFVGVAVGKNKSNGVGLKLGDVLVGVAKAE